MNSALLLALFVQLYPTNVPPATTVTLFAALPSLARAVIIRSSLGMRHIRGCASVTSAVFKQFKYQF